MADRIITADILLKKEANVINDNQYNGVTQKVNLSGRKEIMNYFEFTNATPTEYTFSINSTFDYYNVLYSGKQVFRYSNGVIDYDVYIEYKDYRFILENKNGMLTFFDEKYNIDNRSKMQISFYNEIVQQSRKQYHVNAHNLSVCGDYANFSNRANAYITAQNFGNAYGHLPITNFEDPNNKVDFFVRIITGVEEINLGNRDIRKFTIDIIKFIDFSKNQLYFKESDVIVGEGTPMFEMGTNELIMSSNNFETKTRVLNQYKNGKATINCTVNIGDDTPLFAVGEIAKVYGFDGKSVLRNRDGTDKRFYITSSELRYNGQIKQILEMVEVIESNGV